MGAPQASGEAAMVDTLEKLADLRDRGGLTDEEFVRQKGQAPRRVVGHGRRG
jgi:hypothetical protein